MKTLFKFLSFIGVFLLGVIITLYASLFLITHGPSQKAKSVFVTTFLETGAFKIVPSLLLTPNQIDEIVNSNSLEEMKEDVNTELIDTSKVTDEIEIKEIYGNNYYATLMIVHDPSRVSVAALKKLPSDKGITLDKLVKENNAIAGVNGGLYYSSGNNGGYPFGVLVTDGKIVWNQQNGSGYQLIGFDEDDILRIISISGMNSDQVEKVVKDNKIRDAVTFQEVATGDNNHFVKLIVNGEKRLIKGLGSGANPRTAIGQRKDGAVLLLVTDGRGYNGHLGASAQDLIDVMEEYGAVNAANIDGGSSSSMYYDDKYLMPSVTFYYSNASWNLPDAFIVKKK